MTAPPPPGSICDISSCKDLKLHSLWFTSPKATDSVVTRHFNPPELAFVASIVNFSRELLKVLATSTRSYIEKRATFSETSHDAAESYATTIMNPFSAFNHSKLYTHLVRFKTFGKTIRISQA